MLIKNSIFIWGCYLLLATQVHAQTMLDEWANPKTNDFSQQLQQMRVNSQLTQEALAIIQTQFTQLQHIQHELENDYAAQLEKIEQQAMAKLEVLQATQQRLEAQQLAREQLRAELQAECATQIAQIQTEADQNLLEVMQTNEELTSKVAEYEQQLERLSKQLHNNERRLRDSESRLIDTTKELNAAKQAAELAIQPEVCESQCESELATIQAKYKNLTAELAAKEQNVQELKTQQLETTQRLRLQTEAEVRERSAKLREQLRIERREKRQWQEKYQGLDTLLKNTELAWQHTEQKFVTATQLQQDTMQQMQSLKQVLSENQRQAIEHREKYILAKQELEQLTDYYQDLLSKQQMDAQITQQALVEKLRQPVLEKLEKLETNAPINFPSPDCPTQLQQAQQQARIVQLALTNQVQHSQNNERVLQQQLQQLQTQLQTQCGIKIEDNILIPMPILPGETMTAIQLRELQRQHQQRLQLLTEEKNLLLQQLRQEFEILTANTMKHHTQQLEQQCQASQVDIQQHWSNLLAERDQLETGYAQALRDTQHEVEQLQQQLHLSEQQMTALHQEIQLKHQKQMEKLLTELEQANLTLKQQQVEFNRSQEKLQTVENLAEQLHLQCEHKLQQQQQQCQQQQQQLLANKADFQRIQQELQDKYELEITTLRAQLAEYETKLTAQQAVLADFEQQQPQQQQALQVAEQQLQIIRQELELAKQQHAEELAVQKRKLGILQHEYEELKNNFNNLQSEQQQASRANEQKLELAKQQHAEELANQQRELETLQSEQQQALRAAEQELELAKQQHAEELANQQRELETLQAEQQAQLDQLEQNSTNLALAQAEYKQLQQVMQQKALEHELELTDLRNKQQYLTEQIANLKLQQQSLQVEYDNAIRQAEQQQQQLTTQYEQKIRNLENTIVKSKLDAKSAAENFLQQQRETRTEIANLQTQLDESQQGKAALKQNYTAQIAAMQQQLEDSAGLMANMQQQMQATVNAQTDLQQDYTNQLQELQDKLYRAQVVAQKAEQHILSLNTELNSKIEQLSILQEQEAQYYQELNYKQHLIETQKQQCQQQLAELQAAQISTQAAQTANEPTPEPIPEKVSQIFQDQWRTMNEQCMDDLKKTKNELELAQQALHTLWQKSQ